jgi:hypothetical protein
MIVLVRNVTQTHKYVIVWIRREVMVTTTQIVKERKKKGVETILVDYK